MQQPQHAVVVRFGGDSGLVTILDRTGTETDKQLWLGYRYGRRIAVTDGEVRLMRAPRTHLKLPTSGDRILVYGSRRTRKPYDAVRQWAYAHDHDKCLGGADMTRFRLVAADGGVIWKGGCCPTLPDHPLRTWFGTLPSSLPDGAVVEVAVRLGKSRRWEANPGAWELLGLASRLTA